MDMSLKAWEIEVAVPEPKLRDLEGICTEFLSANVCTVKAVRSFAGKAINISIILYMWRPFLRQVWAALAAADKKTASNAPLHCIWTRQIQGALHWILAFLLLERGTISRTFTFNSCFVLLPPSLLPQMPRSGVLGIDALRPTSKEVPSEIDGSG